MNIKGTLYFKDKAQARIIVDLRTNYYELTSLVEKPILPYELLDVEFNEYNYTRFLEERVMPKDRQDCREILEKIGVPFYEPFLISEHFNFACTEDDFWICKDGEKLTYADILRKHFKVGV